MIQVFVFNFCSVVRWNSNIKVNPRSGSLADIWWPVCIWWTVCILKSQRILCASFSWTDSGLCMYHLSVGSNCTIPRGSLFSPSRALSCIPFVPVGWIRSIYYQSFHLCHYITYSLCVLFCLLSVFALIYLVFMALFCVAIKKIFSFLFRFPLLGYV